MDWFVKSLHHALGMLWLMFWPLVFGLSFSAFLQVFLPLRGLEKSFGKANLKSMLLATGFGAASSSCSYAAAATAKTGFQRGAALIPMLAFMFAATNLVVELSVLLWQLLGWQFVAAEFVGGVSMIGIMWGLVHLTKPAGLERSARQHLQQQSEAAPHPHGHGTAALAGKTLRARLGHRRNWQKIGGAFFMDVKMLWKEVLLGVLIAGFLSVVIPKDWWQALFLNDGAKWYRLLENVLMGPLLALASFVCSDGNVPLASLFWSNGISFGGVAAFIFGDLLIIPLLLLYRKYFGWKTAAYIAAWLYVSMVLASLEVDLLFTGLGWVPQGPRPASALSHPQFSWNYTAWLNLGAVGVILVLVILRFRMAQSTAAQHLSKKPHSPDET